jgi:hypothetical protein
VACYRHDEYWVVIRKSQMASAASAYIVWLLLTRRRTSRLSVSELLSRSKPVCGKRDSLVWRRGGSVQVCGTVTLRLGSPLRAPEYGHAR